MKVYQWNSVEYRKQYKMYYRLMWLFGIITLAMLYLLPESMKVWNLVPLILALGTCYGWYNAQQKDKKLKGGQKR